MHLLDKARLIFYVALVCRTLCLFVSVCRETIFSKGVYIRVCEFHVCCVRERENMDSERLRYGCLMKHLWSGSTWWTYMRELQELEVVWRTGPFSSPSNYENFIVKSDVQNWDTFRSVFILL